MKSRSERFHNPIFQFAPYFFIGDFWINLTYSWSSKTNTSHLEIFFSDALCIFHQGKKSWRGLNSYSLGSFRAWSECLNTFIHTHFAPQHYRKRKVMPRMRADNLWSLIRFASSRIADWFVIRMDNGQLNFSCWLDSVHVA